MRSIHHTLLYDADLVSTRAWQQGFEDAQKVMDRWQLLGIVGYAEAVHTVLAMKGDWVSIFHWDYNPYNEGLVHGIYGLVALEGLDQAGCS